MSNQDLNELLKLILLPLLGGLGTWLAARLRSKPEKRKEALSAERADWELWRDQFAWARTEIKELRVQVERQDLQIARLERRHAQVIVSYADLQSYAHSVVRYLKALLRAVGQEADGGAAILGRVPETLPDLEARLEPIGVKEEDSERTTNVA